MVHAQLAIRPGEGTWVNEVTAGRPESVVRVLATITREDASHLLADVASPDVAEIVERLQRHPSVSGVESLQRAEDHGIVQFEVASQPLLCAAREAGVPVLPPVVVKDGLVSFEVQTTRRRLSDLTGALERAGYAPTVNAIHEDGEWGGLLSERQWSLVSSAIELGYYEVPRECSLTDLAEHVGIAKSTCSELLRRAEGKIVRLFVEEHPRNRFGDIASNRHPGIDTRDLPAESEEETSPQFRAARDFDPEGVLEVMTNESARRLFRHADEPKTVSQLATECDLPQSTAYRMTEKLEEVGLFETVTGRNPGGDPPAKYRRSVDKALLSLEDTVSVTCV